MAPCQSTLNNLPPTKLGTEFHPFIVFLNSKITRTENPIPGELKANDIFRTLREAIFAHLPIFSECEYLFHRTLIALAMFRDQWDQCITDDQLLPAAAELDTFFELSQELLTMARQQQQSYRVGSEYKVKSVPHFLTKVTDHYYKWTVEIIEAVYYQYPVSNSNLPLQRDQRRLAHLAANLHVKYQSLRNSQHLQAHLIREDIKWLNQTTFLAIQLVRPGCDPVVRNLAILGNKTGIMDKHFSQELLGNGPIRDTKFLYYSHCDPLVILHDCVRYFGSMRQPEGVDPEFVRTWNERQIWLNEHAHLTRDPQMEAYRDDRPSAPLTKQKSSQLTTTLGTVQTKAGNKAAKIKPFLQGKPNKDNGTDSYSLSNPLAKRTA